MSNNDLLSQYVSEQDELIRQVHHGLQEDTRTSAAWVSVPTATHFYNLAVSIVVSDSEYEVLSASMRQRERFAQSVRPWPILNFSYFDPPMWRMPKTEVIALYSGQVAPHSVHYYWWPVSIATIPTEGCRVLYNKVGLPQTDRHGGRNNSRIKPISAPDETVSKLCNWFWAALWIEVEALFRDDDEPFIWTYTALNALEVSLGLPKTSEEKRVASSTFLDHLVTASGLTARGAFLTDQLRLKEIDAPSADIFDQMNRFIRFVAEVEPRRLRARF